MPAYHMSQMISGLPFGLARPSASVLQGEDVSAASPPLRGRSSAWKQNPWSADAAT